MVPIRGTAIEKCPRRDSGAGIFVDGPHIAHRGPPLRRIDVSTYRRIDVSTYRRLSASAPQRAPANPPKNARAFVSRLSR
ncbi:hypothetical protein DIE00_32465 [Burkholderia sp. Bp8989]|nr:hypothetical protein DIE05_31640 [Burkholderia sp. Bp8995]RQS39968.1 hypothetical protein DIE00_32465 [Burkholderia sp. Bp8989]